MMKVTIGPGETLVIRFMDDDGLETDGEFKVFFDTKKYPNAIVVQETDGFDGSIKGVGGEILYHEEFLVDTDPEVVTG